MPQTEEESSLENLDEIPSISDPLLEECAQQVQMLVMELDSASQYIMMLQASAQQAVMDTAINTSAQVTRYYEPLLAESIADRDEYRAEVLRVQAVLERQVKIRNALLVAGGSGVLIAAVAGILVGVFAIP